MDSKDWWRSAVTYQLYIRSFADSDGDGLGDISGIRSRLSYITRLGVDAIWVNPWYPSPQRDGGYDVADYRDIDPGFGTLDDAERLIDDAHAAGLRVLLDIVPNHTSIEHGWFKAALAATPGSPERARYWFRRGLGVDGSEPPNDWQSVFGGPAWTRVSERGGQPGEWYLHLFDVSQPDLNWANPEVVTEFESILRFWFDRGADGFRIDVAHGLAKDPDLPSLNLPDGDAILAHTYGENHPYWDRPEVQDVYQGWRRIADSYDPPRVFVAEAWVDSADALAEYVVPTRLHSAFDFEFIRSPWNAKSLRTFAQTSLTAHDRMGAPVMWVQSNHDVVRHVTRLGRDQAALDGADALHAGGPSDPVLGIRRARAAILLELALPGGVYLYQGEELGLEEVLDLPEELLQDPTWERSGHTVRGRDGCRVPLPWTPSGPSLGFGPPDGRAPWLPQPRHWPALSAQTQESDRGSMLWLYRDALRLRHELPQIGLGGGIITWTGDEPDVLGFTRGQGFVCMLNTGSAPIPLPPGEVALSSVPIEDGLLPADAAAWILTG